MSRIFDALQRSGTEQSGVEYPDLVSVVTEVFEAPRPMDRSLVEPASTLETPAQPLPVPFVAQAAPSAVPPGFTTSAAQPTKTETFTQEVAADSPVDFPSLEVSVLPSSRLVFLTEPDSLAAEKFRFLGVRLRQLQQNRPLQKVLVTSTIPEEGKSTVSANLAGVLARRKQSVLLIEGDLRRPTLAQQFGLGKLAGLGEWLQSGRQRVTNVYRLDGPNFWFMPAGNPPENPLELLQSGRLSVLMEQLASLFDWIIVDSPPLLPLADTTVWARVTDGTLLVAREGKSERKQLQRGLEALKKSDLLGVVLNGCAHPDHKSYYQRYSPAAK
ncbi:MAG TPA: CpsD/CapB family tyrosine-protein kinase [Terriglobales bacterium]|nr:CpsD/CapB family tyrosine-protein kinase [Terriglobales bacterium]